MQHKLEFGLVAFTRCYSHILEHSLIETISGYALAGCLLHLMVDGFQSLWSPLAFQQGLPGHSGWRQILHLGSVREELFNQHEELMYLSPSGSATTESFLCLASSICECKIMAFHVYIKYPLASVCNIWMRGWVYRPREYYQVKRMLLPQGRVDATILWRNCVISVIMACWVWHQYV